MPGLQLSTSEKKTRMNQRLRSLSCFELFFDWEAMQLCSRWNFCCTLIANCRFFFLSSCCFSLMQKQAVQLNVLSWLLFPFYKAWLLWYVSFVLVCRLRFDTIGPARADLLETPRHACPRVCVHSFIQLPLKGCHAFTSLLVSSSY